MWFEILSIIAVSMFSEIFIIYILTILLSGNKRLICWITIIYGLIIVSNSVYQAIELGSPFTIFHIYAISSSLGPIINAIFFKIYWHVNLFGPKTFSRKIKLRKEDFLSEKESNKLVFFMSFLVPVLGAVSFVALKYSLTGIVILASTSLLEILYIAYYFISISKTKEYIILKLGRTNITYLIKEVREKKIIKNHVIFNDLYFVDYLGKVKVTYLNKTNEIHHIFSLKNDGNIDLSNSGLDICDLLYRDIIESEVSFFSNLRIKEVTRDDFKLLK